MDGVINIEDYRAQFGGVLKNDEKLQKFAKDMLKQLDRNFTIDDIKNLQTTYNLVPTGVYDNDLFEAIMQDLINQYEHDSDSLTGSEDKEFIKYLLMGMEEIFIYYENRKKNYNKKVKRQDIIIIFWLLFFLFFLVVGFYTVYHWVFDFIKGLF